MEYTDLTTQERKQKVKFCRVTEHIDVSPTLFAVSSEQVKIALN